MTELEAKKKYNYYLKRYYDGCNYITEYPEQAEKYEKDIIKFLDILNYLLKEKIKKFTDEEVTNGFKV